MPLGPFAKEILRLLARNRNPESFVGCATILHQSPSSTRASQDIDIFHDTPAAVGQAAETDLQTLRAAGYLVKMIVRQEAFCRAIVTRETSQTKLEWV